MTHPLIGDLEDELRKLGWVKDARVRLRAVDWQVQEIVVTLSFASSTLGGQQPADGQGGVKGLALEADLKCMGRLP